MRNLIVAVVLVISLSACNLPAAGLPATAVPSESPQPAPSLPAMSTASPAPALPGESLVAVPGSTQKICQLLGDVDWETGQPTAARTLTNAGLAAADLGYPVEHQGKLILLFGDSWPPPHPQNETPAQSEVPPDDAVGITVRTAPPDASTCLDLQVNHTIAGKFIPASITGPIKVKQGFFNVPSGGVSAGGLLYAFFWTAHCVHPNPLNPSPLTPLARPVANPFNDCPETDARNSLGKSVLAQSSDDGQTFSQVIPMPAGFVYVTAVNSLLQADIPTQQRLGIFIFGAPRYRASIPYMAYAAPEALANPAAWHFFTGLDSTGQPEWVTSKAWFQNAAYTTTWNPPGQPEIFSVTSNAGRCVGEFSITWNSVLGKWLLLYNCWGGIVARIAAAPWGPWSAPTTLLSPGPAVDCRLVMVPAGCPGQKDFWPALQKNGMFEAGSFYAPFVLNRYTTTESSVNGNRRSTIYWLVSPWNPYEVTVMRTTLEVDPAAPGQ
ncbi:MAG: DUF4185 domain-containing protein [Anaerolineales bacterium]